ncbi:LytTR family DNA-binding domain-containing protein [Spirosoma sordidisoli]|nr:LytTR family DNA-binding domain-containing protein [Spirosoma sordidisoli]
MREIQINPDEVMYAVGDANYAHIHFANAKPIVYARTLKLLHERWPVMLRLHKHVLINPNFIRSVHVPKRNGGVLSVTMRDGSSHDAGRRRKAGILKFLNQNNVLKP